MEKLEDYKIVFASLKNGKHNFDFEVKQEFFQLFGADQEFDKANLKSEIVLDKHETFLELNLRIHGTVELKGDLSGDPFEFPINPETKVMIKFGEKYDDNDDEIIIIPRESQDFNVSQLLYETTVLAIPMKKISPEVSKEALDLLEKYSPDHEKEHQETDPRWEALKKLKK